MTRGTLSEAASVDETGILTDLYGKAGWNTVVKFQELFYGLYLRLADIPDSGALRPMVGAGVRVAVVGPYLVLYRHTAEDESVTVLRIVHGRRRISSRLLR